MNKIKSISIILIIVFCAFVLAVVSGCHNEALSNRKRGFEEKFFLELSSDPKLVCYLYETSRDGRDEYYVWQFENEPTQILNTNKYYEKVKSSETSEEAEQIKQYFKKEVEQSLGGQYEKVPEQFRPNWECEYVVAYISSPNYSADDKIRIGPSYFYDIEQKLLIAWYIAR